MSEPIKYYVQDSRQFVGNDMLWWRNGGGYTTSIDEAQVFDEVDAMSIHRSRKSDVPWQTNFIDPAIRRVIDMQYVERDANDKHLEELIQKYSIDKG